MKNSLTWKKEKGFRCGSRSSACGRFATERAGLNGDLDRSKHRYFHTITLIFHACLTRWPRVVLSFATRPKAWNMVTFLDFHGIRSLISRKRRAHCQNRRKPTISLIFHAWLTRAPRVPIACLTRPVGKGRERKRKGRE